MARWVSPWSHTQCRCMHAREAHRVPITAGVFFNGFKATRSGLKCEISINGLNLGGHSHFRIQINVPWDTKTMDYDATVVRLAITTYIFCSVRSRPPLSTSMSSRPAHRVRKAALDSPELTISLTHPSPKPLPHEPVYLQH